jgi:hypothetical protein
LKAILDYGRRKEIFEDYKSLRQKLGGAGASEKAAAHMVERLQKK